MVYTGSDLLWAGQSWDRIPEGAKFSTPLQTGPWAHPASYTVVTRFCPGVKWPGRGVDHTPPHSSEVKERVELYIYSTSVPSWPVLGWALWELGLPLACLRKLPGEWSGTGWVGNTSIGCLFLEKDRPRAFSWYPLLNVLGNFEQKPAKDIYRVIKRTLSFKGTPIQAGTVRHSWMWQMQTGICKGPSCCLLLWGSGHIEI
jgi:hypothetical protein